MRKRRLKEISDIQLRERIQNRRGPLRELTYKEKKRIREKHWPKLRKALENYPLPEGSYHRSQLGIDHTQLDGFKGAYHWGPHEEKLQQFQKAVDGGKFIDETGSPCDTCVDEQQFYGCPHCDFNPLADEMEEEWEDPEYDTGPYGGYP